MAALVLTIVAAVIGAFLGAAIDRLALAWRPATKVDAAMGAVDQAPLGGAVGWLPVVDWLRPVLDSRASTLTVMRACTEIVGAVALATLAWNAGAGAVETSRAIGNAVLIIILLHILRIDWQHHLIQERMIYLGVVVALITAAMRSMNALVAYAATGLVAAVVFFALYLLARVLYRQAALGFGDVLLALLIGAAVGPLNALGALFWGMLLASVGGIGIAIARRRLRSYFAYGAYLALAAIAVLALPPLSGRVIGFF